MSVVVAAGIILFLLVALGVVFSLYQRVSARSAEVLARLPAARLYWLAAILMTSAIAAGGSLVVWLVFDPSQETTIRLAHTGVALALWLLTALFIPFFIVMRNSYPFLSSVALAGGAVSLPLAAYLTRYPTFRDLYDSLPPMLPLASGWLTFAGGLVLLLAILRWLRRAEREIW